MHGYGNYLFWYVYFKKYNYILTIKFWQLFLTQDEVKYEVTSSKWFWNIKNEKMKNHLKKWELQL